MSFPVACKALRYAFRLPDKIRRRKAVPGEFAAGPRLVSLEPESVYTRI
jgi:hypothetical protein